MTARTAEILRETGETRISVAVNLDGTGSYDMQDRVSASSITCWTSSARHSP